MKKISLYLDQSSSKRGVYIGEERDVLVGFWPWEVLEQRHTNKKLEFLRLFGLNFQMAELVKKYSHSENPKDFLSKIHEELDGEIRKIISRIDEYFRLVSGRFDKDLITQEYLDELRSKFGAQADITFIVCGCVSEERIKLARDHGIKIIYKPCQATPGLYKTIKEQLGSLIEGYYEESLEKRLADYKYAGDVKF